MNKTKEVTIKTLYGLLFVAVIPFLLILWARSTEDLIKLPVPGTVYPGYLLLFAGAILILAGIVNLWFYGKGLPMNAFPPKQFVRKGIYALMKHPVYTGAILLSFGLSVIFHSSSGLWMVSPLFTLMVAVFVAGFENERTIAIFGKQEYRTFFSLPHEVNSTPSFQERLSSYFLGYIPWIIAYETFILAGKPPDAIITNFPFENDLPVAELTGLFYILIYFIAPLMPLIIKTRAQLKQFITDMWFVSVIAGIFYFAFPFIVIQREFVPHTLLGKIIIYDRSMDGVTSSLPSFHVIWAFIAAKYLSGSMKRAEWIWYLLAVLISVSCVTAGFHSIPDIIAGFTVYLAALYRHQIWDFIRHESEKLANSWKEWRWGPVRLINHGFYGGAAGFAGFLIAGCFSGNQLTFPCFIIFIFIIIGSALWAQLIEGSPKLLRPYGYYGGLTGGLTGCIAASLIFSINIYILFASLAMAAPWIQAIGRLRCLVQGCCHGKPSDEKTGIRFIHPFSRVNKISGLKGVPLHPTQLYSIACNIVSGLALLRLYSLGMPAVFIAGIYLVLNGLGRFVEESFRGEAQTPYWDGMRMYQWIAIINIILGAYFTTIHNDITLSFHFNIKSLLPAVLTGLIVLLASGVDFPESNRRFARLTSN